MNGIADAPVPEVKERKIILGSQRTLYNIWCYAVGVNLEVKTHAPWSKEAGLSVYTLVRVWFKPQFSAVINFAWTYICSCKTSF